MIAQVAPSSGVSVITWLLPTVIALLSGGFGAFFLGILRAGPEGKRISAEAEKIKAETGLTLQQQSERAVLTISAGLARAERELETAEAEAAARLQQVQEGYEHRIQLLEQMNADKDATIAYLRRELEDKARRIGELEERVGRLQQELAEVSEELHDLKRQVTSPPPSSSSAGGANG